MTTLHTEGDTGWVDWSNTVDALIAALTTALGGKVDDAEAVLLAGAQVKAGILTLTTGLVVPPGGTVSLPDGSLAILDVNGLTGRLTDIDAAIVAAAASGGTGSKVWVRNVGDTTIPTGAVNGDVIFTKTV